MLDPIFVHDIYTTRCQYKTTFNKANKTHKVSHIVYDFNSVVFSVVFTYEVTVFVHCHAKR